MAKFIFLLAGFSSLLAPQAFANTTRFYTVQFSSYNHSPEARELIDKLKRKGVDAYEIRAFIHGKTLHRVCAGYFENIKTAKQARVHFAQIVHKKDIIVQSFKGSSLPDEVIFPKESDARIDW